MKKKKIKYLHKILIEKSNFNILNLIFYKEIRVIYYFFIVDFMLLYFLKLNIFLCINWIVLILLCISIFLGPYVKFIDYKMDKKIEKNKQIRRKINEECKIDYKWKYFFSPIDLKKNILKLDMKIKIVFDEQIKEKYEFDKIEIQKQLESRIDKIMNSKKGIMESLINNSFLIVVLTSFWSLLDKYYSSLMQLIVQNVNDKQKIITELNNLFFDQLKVYILIAAIIIVIKIFHKIYIEDPLISDELLRLYEIDDFLDTVPDKFILKILG